MTEDGKIDPLAQALLNSWAAQEVKNIWEHYQQTTVLSYPEYQTHRALREALGLVPDYNNGCRGCIKKAVKETYDKIKELNL